MYIIKKILKSGISEIQKRHDDFGCSLTGGYFLVRRTSIFVLVMMAEWVKAPAVWCDPWPGYVQ